MREQFVALSERVTKIESQRVQQPLEVPHPVEESTVEDDRLSITATHAEENDILSSNSDGPNETSLAGFVPPLDDFMSPVVDVQSKNTHGNLLDNVDANNVDTGETPTSVKSTTGFFDPEQTTARRWVPSAAFGTFLEKNFRRWLNTEQVNEIIGEYSPPETDACVAPLLDKSILTYIPSSRKKFIGQQDKDLALIQRATLNAAAPLCCLHDRPESNENISNEDLRTTLQQSLCFLCSANHITTTLHRKKILAAINPDKVQLAEQEFPKAGKMLFGEDLTTLAAKHSELTRSLSKNLHKPGYSKMQSNTSGNFPRTKYNTQQTRGKSNRPFPRNSASNNQQRFPPEANQVQSFRPRRDQPDRPWFRQ